MDLLTGNIRTIYLRYLSAAFGSAMISSIYGLVDAAMVGQVPGTGRCRRPGHIRAHLEHHLQPGTARRHRRLDSLCRRPGQPERRHREPLLHCRCAALRRAFGALPGADPPAAETHAAAVRRR